jgi:hypothetical protein
VNGEDVRGARVLSIGKALPARGAVVDAGAVVLGLATHGNARIDTIGV